MATMSKEEREEYLSRPHVGVIAIEQPGRGPLAVPVWYGYEPGGNVEVLMGADSKKGKLIAASGRYTITVQREELPYKYVMAEGPVIESRPADVEADTRPMARRYLGDELGDQYVEGGSDDSSIVVVMRPEHWYSTDYGKT
jgi:hypothetical protein